jgi:hypothetical protein
MRTLSIWQELGEELKHLALRRLGPLAHLVGVWEGTGYFSVFRPNGANKTPFFFQQNTTKETLTFIPLIMSVPDRGALLNTGQGDIHVRGLIYEQLIVDEHDIANVFHFESGQWLLIPETIVPQKGKTVARQATILHGVSFTATGDAPPVTPNEGKPDIIKFDVTPTGPQANDPGYLDQFHNAPLLAGLPAGSIQDPSLILRRRTETQNVIDSVTYDLSAQLEPDQSKEISCGISNIPFLDKNSQATSLRSVFYVEHIEEGGGSSFMQLQYIQRIPLFFDNISWPHAAVATLRRVQL